MTLSASHKLAFATYKAIPGPHPDDFGLVAALQQLGIEVTPCVWNDPAVDWQGFDAVLIRTPWDYFKLYPEFLRWLDLLDRLSVRVINDTALLRWNSEKRYLLELAEQGVDIISTQIMGHGQLAAALQAMPGRDVIVKPTTSGTAWHTVRGKAGDAAFSAEVAGLPDTLNYMLQAFVPEIVSAGEWSLMYFEGRYSHAVIKRPAAGDYRVQNDWGGTSERAEPDAAIRAAAERVLAATAALGHRDQAYARIDGVVVDGRFMLMELEMTEPLLHFKVYPSAAQVFAENLAAKLRSLP